MSGGAGGTAGEIINLNVGGTKFSTSRQTLTAIPVSESRFFNIYWIFELSEKLGKMRYLYWYIEKKRVWLWFAKKIED